MTTVDRVLPSVHVQQLKLYTPRAPEQLVRRVTSVIEPDSNTDAMDNQYAEAPVTGKVDSDSRETDLDKWESDLADTLTKEPGQTELVQFKFETGLHPPICQGPSNTPQALISSVNKELEWLNAKRYIRESSNNWASPKVTVHKPDDDLSVYRFQGD